MIVAEIGKKIQTFFLKERNIKLLIKVLKIIGIIIVCFLFITAAGFYVDFIIKTIKRAMFQSEYYPLPSIMGIMFRGILVVTIFSPIVVIWNIDDIILKIKNYRLKLNK